MYPTHRPLNTPHTGIHDRVGNCSLHCSNAGIHARVVVIGVAGKHNRERA